MRSLFDADPPQTAFGGRRLPWKLDGLACFGWLGVGAYLYLNLFMLPNTPILQGDDQVFFWMNAQRMLYGERAYVDFFQYTPPGTDLFFFSLFKLFGTHVWVLNTAVLVLGATLCLTCLRIANQIGQGLGPLGAEKPM